MTRRRFLAGTAAVGAALTASWWSREAFASPKSLALRKFIQPLRGIGPGGMAVAMPDDFQAPVTGVTHYSLAIRQFEDRLHPDLGPTTLWGYHPDSPLGGQEPGQRHLSGIIVMHRGTPIQITSTDERPAKHILPVDTSAPTTRYTPECQHGPVIGGWSRNVDKVLNPGLLPGQAERYYPNNQSARLLWHHDHGHARARLDTYVGIARVAIVRDRFEASLRDLGLPDFVEKGGREIPIIIQDKVFVGRDIGTKDPTWPGLKSVGSLWYPHIYETDRWELGAHPLGMPTDPSAVPEMFGDTMLANGTVYPQATVEARRYRLRVLNACDSRFLNLQLYVDDGSSDGITLNSAMRPTNPAGPDFLVLGTEGGFLPRPARVASNCPFDPSTLGGSLITAPSERWDLLVDFSRFEGKKVILYNDAPAPFPAGAAINDYFPGSSNPTPTTPGFGPNSRQIMRFDVVPATGQDQPLRITDRSDLTPELDRFLVPPGTVVQGGVLHLPPGVPVRHLTIEETFDGYGRVLRSLGTDPQAPAGSGHAHGSPSTETPGNREAEVWQIANLTRDTHPVDWHPVTVQVLARQPFDVAGYRGTPSYTGPARGPDVTELGWKEAVRANPGEVTTVIMRFNPLAVPFTVRQSPWTAGKECAGGCHILEHEGRQLMGSLLLEVSSAGHASRQDRDA